jgi:hypothetical protein
MTAVAGNVNGGTVEITCMIKETMNLETKCYLAAASEYLISPQKATRGQI